MTGGKKSGGATFQYFRNDGRDVFCYHLLFKVTVMTTWYDNLFYLYLTCAEPFTKVTLAEPVIYRENTQKDCS